eukprot:COSAG01_NODE_25053_length_757_cov_0.933131_1_plen_26_part_01
MRRSSEYLEEGYSRTALRRFLPGPKL